MKDEPKTPKELAEIDAKIMAEYAGKRVRVEGTGAMAYGVRRIYEAYLRTNELS